MLDVKEKVFYFTGIEDVPFVDVGKIYELKFNQEETDTLIILYSKYAQEQGYEQCIVHSPDSDIFPLLMQDSHTIDISLFYTDVKDK